MSFPTDYSKFNKSQKFVFMVQLLQRTEGALVSELKDKFDLKNDRTLRRYIHDLKDMNLPIRFERISDDEGEKDRRMWIDANYQRTGVQISLLEWVSLHFGRTLFGFLQGTNLTQDIDDALERLSTLAGDINQKITSDMSRKFMAVPEHAKDHSEKSEVIDEILSALLYQNPVEAFYTKIATPGMRKYVLYPYTLVTYRHGLYIFAFDTKDHKIKTFAIDRFHSFKRIRNQHFELPKSYRPEKIVEDAFGIMGGKVEEVSLRFNRYAAPYIQERTWHHSQETFPVENAELILKMNVAVAPELISWIMGFGPDVTVLSPPSLKERIYDLHKRALENLK
jgi:predicted DNA-binding transcriptional regulator YafY